MKNTEKKNLIFGFLSKAGLKRMVIALYCIVPLFIFAVGFSAWTIIGHDVGNGGGSFVADGIINSYDYIAVKSGNFNDVHLYPTGIYQDGKLTDSATIEAKYTLQIGKCYEDLLKNATDKKLYADFTLNFVGGEQYKAFYDSLSYKINVSESTSGGTSGGSGVIVNGTPLTYDGVTFTGSQNATSSNYTVSLKMDLSQFNANDTIKKLDLNFVYTVEPKTAGDYQTIYNQLVNNNLTLMVDVRITDVAPNA